MRIENLFLKREKNVPADAVTNGHKLSLRGGFVHQTAGGIYTYSSIGWTAIQNISRVIRQEMNALGGQEIFMPVLSPMTLWKETGRENIDVLLHVKNRSGQELALNPTHEEIVVDYARSALQSYKQLPFMLYQIQDKYRDEARARAGIMRGREFLMKDAYSFHADDADLDAVYDQVLSAYKRIFDRIGLENVVDVLAPGGDMSSQFSHEFQWINETGEDVIYTCACGYKSNKEILTDGDKDAADVVKCPKCGGQLQVKRAVEVGNIFRLGDKYSRPMKLEFSREDGTRGNPVMGCYGIGVSRCLGALLEQSGSDSVAKFNLEIAPYKVHIITLGDAGREAAEELYGQLQAAGVQVIIDATDDRAGSKFANADLLGAPIRIISSDKNFAENKFEVKGGLLPDAIDIAGAAEMVLKVVG